MGVVAVFYRLGLLAVKFRWIVILCWALLVVISFFFAPRVVSQLKSGFGESDTESRVAQEILQEEFGYTEAAITLVFHSDELTVSDPIYVSEVRQVLNRAESLPEVSDVSTFQPAGELSDMIANGYTTYATISLNLTLDAAMDFYPNLEDKLLNDRSSGEADNSQVDVRVWATGGVPIFSDLNEASERDLRRAEIISLPLVLGGLVIVFGGLIAAGVPVAMGIVSLPVALAALFFLAQVTDVSIFALNIASFLGLGVAVDYSLLIVSRFREELEFRPKDQAVAHAVAKAGRTLVFSSITSILGLSGLLLFKLTMLRSIGLGGMVVISMSLLVALTLLPAILSLLGSKVNSLSILPRSRSGVSIWGKLGFWVMDHPILVAVPLLAFLVLLGTPFLGVKLGAPWASMLPSDAQARQGWEVVAEEIGKGELAPILVVVRDKGQDDSNYRGILSNRSTELLYELTGRITKDSRVSRVESIFNFPPGLSLEEYQTFYSQPEGWPPEIRQAIASVATDSSTIVQVYSRYDPVSPETKALVKDIRSMHPTDTVDLYVTGVTASLMDSITVMYQDLVKGIFFVMGTIFIVLVILFRSVFIPLKAVVMNAMSIFASYGALVYIFQDGHFQGLLGFQSGGFTEATVPILLFFVIFGLSMDYEIFLLSRIKESYDQGLDNVKSVARGLEKTGRIITSAALILVLVSASFATAQVALVKALGVGVAIAIFLDATLVRALLVPALMRIMGDWNWWIPAFLGRVIPKWKANI